MPRIHVEVEGFTPYYFNKQVDGPVPKTLEQNVQRAIDIVYCHGKDKNNFAVENLGNKFTAKTGNTFMPGNQFRGSMRSAISLMKMKVEKSNKRAIDLLNATVFVEPSWIEFNPAIKMKHLNFPKHWIITDQNKGTGIDKYFSCTGSEWYAQFDIEHMGLLDLSFLETALVNGGLYCGVGGRRIHKSGRFNIKKFEVSD